MTSFCILVRVESWAIGWHPTLGRVNVSTDLFYLMYFRIVDFTAGKAATANTTELWPQLLIFKLTETRMLVVDEFTPSETSEEETKNPSVSQHSETTTTTIQPFRYLPTPIHVGVILHMAHASTHTTCLALLLPYPRALPGPSLPFLTILSECIYSQRDRRLSYFLTFIPYPRSSGA